MRQAKLTHWLDEGRVPFLNQDAGRAGTSHSLYILTCSLSHTHTQTCSHLRSFAQMHIFSCLVHMATFPLGHGNIQSNTSQQFERYTVPPLKKIIICARLFIFVLQGLHLHPVSQGADASSGARISRHLVQNSEMGCHPLALPQSLQKYHGLACPGKHGF